MEERERVDKCVVQSEQRRVALRSPRQDRLLCSVVTDLPLLHNSFRPV